MIPAPAEVAPETTAPATTTNPATTETMSTSPFERASSALEHLYNATDGTNNFMKVVDFLGTMAEAESFKGKQTYNDSSSASGIFHFLVGNGGGHSKEGKKVHLGQYDAKGVLRTSSFETAKKRLKAMVTSERWSDSIAKQPGLVSEINTVLQAKTPDDLTPQRQAILAYANLKMTSGDFSNFLQGKDTAANVYGKVWVTHGKTHSTNDIHKNWKNALERGVNKSNLEFFGIKSAVAANNPYNVNMPITSYKNGGEIIEEINKKKTLI